MHTEYRLPAEWELQSATLLAWPVKEADWGEQLPAAQREWAQLITAIAAHQQVVLLVAPGHPSAVQRFEDQPGVHVIEVDYNDVWCRDYGPVTMVRSGQRLGLDFYFNGWGGKYPAALDNRVNTLLARHALFNRFEFRQYLFALEGGAIDSNGAGSLLINRHCLRARHPNLSRSEIDYELYSLLNIDRVLAIDIEPLPGDDTDGHIDTLARFISRDRIAYQSQASRDRDELLRRQLEALDGDSGQAVELVALPCPRGTPGNLPANYANFLFVNDAVLVPAYGVDSDEEAREVLAMALPDHSVKLVEAGAMIHQFGGPHCATMHLPGALG